jgi:flagellar hook protein FlgE
MYLGVIGNNLANINTVGYKSSAVQFADLVSQSVGGSSANPMQIGLGVGVGTISPSFTQGAIESSQLATNVAIQGSGFFVVSNATGVGYTRAGNFTLDNTGTLVTPDGAKVQGWTTVNAATGLVNTSGVPGNIVVPPGALRAPTATTSFKTMTNLNAAAPIGSTFSSAITTYDALGTAHVLTVKYTKTAANAWSTEMTLPGEDVAGGTAGTPFVLATGTLALTFDATGQLATINAAAPTDRTITTPAYTNGAAASSWNWDLMDGTTAAITQYATESSTSSITQSGNSAGRVDEITIATDGRILASFGASGAVAIGQIAIANFNNAEGLSKAGSNRYTATDASGVPNVGVAGTGGRGELIGNALEQSNVDVAEEFTRMILAQRGYQANAKTITVSDELMVETMNLKR